MISVVSVMTTIIISFLTLIIAGIVAYIARHSRPPVPIRAGNQV